MIVILLTCVPAVVQAEDTPITSQTPWKNKMQELNLSLNALLTDVCSDQRYYDPKNSSRIESEIKSISTFSHDLNKKSLGTHQADPTLQLFSGFLANETSEAYRSFRDGQLTYAREILRAIPGDCLACHSRNALGPDFSALPSEPNAPLSFIETAEFYAATRQFDRAVGSFRNILQARAQEESLDSTHLEKSVHDALLIAVRIKKDPDLAKAIIGDLLSNVNTPHYLKDDAIHWDQSLKNWKSEGVRKVNTPEGMYAEAIRLIAIAHAHQTYAMDHSQDIVYLRASSVLYDFLQADPNGKRVSDALLLLGMCYEVLSPHRMEDLHNVYYEACIQRSPHTEIARTCYHRYEQSMYLGYSGSSGTHLPEDIKKKMLELWSLASENKGKL